MLRSLNLAWLDDALAAMREFHFLHDKQERERVLTIEEGRTLLLLRNVFEPKIAGHGGRRRLVMKMPVHRRAVAVTESGRQDVLLVGVSLREVDIVLQMSLRVGQRLRIIVPSGGAWMVLGGHVRRCDIAAELANIAVGSVRALDRVTLT